jgi:tetratricopeptide (TPR) repeat protein
VSLPFSYTSLGDALNAIKDYESAIKYYKEGYQISKEINNRRGIMLSAYSMGRTLNFMDDLDLARQYLDEAKALAIEINHEVANNLIIKQLEILSRKSN